MKKNTEEKEEKEEKENSEKKNSSINLIFFPSILRNISAISNANIPQKIK